MMLAVIPHEEWLILLICFIFTSIGFAGANIFYDAFLVDVTSSDRMHRISANGFALGYIGSTVPFIIGIALIILSQQAVIPLSVTVSSQAAIAITALWWGLFTIPMIKHVEQQYYVDRVPRPVTASFKKLLTTIKNIKAYRALFLFLLAYFFYIDGVNTVMTMATVFGTDLGLDSTSLLLVLFITQIVSAPLTILFGRLAERFNDKKMLLSGILIYIFICIYAYFIKTVVDFWVIAMMVASAQGGIQALSRSYYAKLIPKQSSNEFFGFYNIIGKFAAILGPVLVGITAQLTGNTSNGLFSLIILFIIGGILLLRVPDQGKPASPPTISV